MTTPTHKRFWFYRPTVYWFGWRTLVPLSLGGDEWNRRTIVLGWNLTGQVIIAISQ